MLDLEESSLRVGMAPRNSTRSPRWMIHAFDIGLTVDSSEMLPWMDYVMQLNHLDGLQEDGGTGKSRRRYISCGVLS